MNRLLDMLFGCWHTDYTFPIAVGKHHRPTNLAVRLTGTYVVCLECGREFAYDWKNMKVVTEKEARRNAKEREEETIRVSAT